MKKSGDSGVWWQKPADNQFHLKNSTIKACQWILKWQPRYGLKFGRSWKNADSSQKISTRDGVTTSKIPKWHYFIFWPSRILKNFWTRHCILKKYDFIGIWSRFNECAPWTAMCDQLEWDFTYRVQGIKAYIDETERNILATGYSFCSLQMSMRDYIFIFNDSDYKHLDVASGCESSILLLSLKSSVWVSDWLFSFFIGPMAQHLHEKVTEKLSASLGLSLKKGL